MRRRGALFILGILFLLCLLLPHCTPPPSSGVFRVNLGGEPGTLDPHHASRSVEITVIRQCFDGLLGFDEDLSLRPLCAVEIPSPENGGISPDGLTYTFKLREDLRWSDGKPLVAGDFVYAIKRLLDPETAAPYAYLYRNVKEVEAPDDHTLIFTLSQPDPTFPVLLALFPAVPLRKDIVEKFGDEWAEPPHYICNGPFRLHEWKHRSHILLKPNLLYNGPRRKPDFDIEFQMILDFNIEYAAFRRGELDMARVPPGLEREIMGDPSLSPLLIRSPQPKITAIFFNTRRKPLDDPNVRRAFSAAIDRRAFVEEVLSGVGRPALSWIPPGIPGYDPSIGKEWDFDPRRAGELLSAAGFPEGRGFPEISLIFVDSPTNRIIAEFVQREFHEHLHIEVRLEGLDEPSFGRRFRSRDYDLAFATWSADYPDPQSLLFIFRSDSPFNLCGWSNAKFDELSSQAQRELDPERRLALWREAHRILINELPAVPVIYPEKFWLRSRKVQGIKVTPIDGAVAGELFLSAVKISS